MGVHFVDKAVDAAKAEKARYGRGEDRPLGSYLAVSSVYGAVVAALTGLVHARGRGLPDRIELTDVALTAVATHKLSRLLAKGPVASWLRAPFTQFSGQSGAAEIAEEARDGPRHAIGELLTCPFCISQWIATGLVFGLALAPRSTRLVTGLFSALSGADFLQFAYALAQKHAQA
jgi:Protein of unknown function (DUF1360)